MLKDYALTVHGGAKSAPDMQPYHTSIINALTAGQERLARGSAALDVVEHCVMLLEDNDLFNAGKGSALTEAGTVEMDAAIMEGQDLTKGNIRKS